MPWNRRCWKKHDGYQWALNRFALCGSGFRGPSLRSNSWNCFKGTRSYISYMSEVRILFCTVSSLEDASRIARQLVSDHLTACVNVLPGVKSIYRWKDKVNEDEEILMILKTEESRIPEIEKAIRAMHSYQVPELLAVPVVYG